MKKITNVLFIGIWILLLMMLSNQVSEAEIKEKNIINYPSTPEGVVEAFCKEDFIGTGAGLGDWIKIQQYTTWPDAPGWDESILVRSFKVTKIRENPNVAEVKVEYKSIGRLYSDEIGPVFQRVKSNEVVIYKLIKKGGQWKIESPQLNPHVGAETKIKLLKETITPQVKDPKKIKRLNQVVKNIEDELAKNESN